MALRPLAHSPAILVVAAALLAAPPGDAAPSQNHELRHLGSAWAYLDDVGVSVVDVVEDVGRCMREHARRLASSPAVFGPLATRDSEKLSEIARDVVESSDLVDVVAFFGAEGDLLAVRDSDSRSNIYHSDRLRAHYSTVHEGRDLVRECFEAAAVDPSPGVAPDEDFTPLVFDGIGLALTHATPVRVDGALRGVVSVRLRFDHVLRRLRASEFFDGGNRIWFVTKGGRYYDDRIRKGEVEPPVPSEELAEILRAIDGSQGASFEYEREDRVLSLFEIPGVHALEGGGVHVVLDASPEWIEQVARRSHAREAALESRVWSVVAIAALLALALGIAWSTRLRLRRQFERADRASRSKSSFLASTSHEIRTPMTAILGYAEMLAVKGEGAASQELADEAIEAIQRHGQHLLALIGDVLDFAKIEAGAIVLDPQPCDPGRIARDVGELLQGTADEKGISLVVDVADSLPACVRVDPTRLRQVLLNLVGNAVKFTEAGSVTLRASGAEGVTGKRLVFEVVDTGIGMTPLAAAAIFDPYVQAEASTTRRFGGTGLGLSISRQLAELMGGTIECESAVGEGSRFTVTVRVPVLDRSALELTQGVSAFRSRAAGGEGERTAADVDLVGTRVLLADDSATNRRLFGLILGKAGVEVTFAENGREAVSAWEEAPEPFALVLMDAQMPIMNGTQALEALRELGAELPIVVLTADAVSGAREGYLAAGFDDFVTKPISRRELLDVVARHLPEPSAT